MGLEFFTWDTQVTDHMALDFPEANYHIAEYFRPPDFLLYSREKILPIVPGWDVTRLVNVAQLFEPFYLWDFTNLTTLNETIGQVAGVELDYYVYGDVQVNLGAFNKQASINAYVWYNNFIPAYAELSLSIPVIPGQNLTLTEMLNARSVYNVMKNLVQTQPVQHNDISHYLYQLNSCPQINY